ncbi:Chromatin target of PRMT1 protein C-terminal domain-containing protein [Caenorhabditis elegans]|uniref:Chromatin target of PRMT1 protein C-terminal domain-containing protein n=1 Tax=Caenorhabditis elegans TaxID=6239 RepID=Q17561_CAEEL|nr:Chromatin target of PRMT1 protein C-terminal domain-containing protein [Caenorhabditis elegans]CAA92438.1 Chromatin target of PRMT1 protein C-terminal domain-containing protein [Caenorhabditis elegans]|eukprot:NP_501588.1 Ref/ALY RNA export adaptor family [Caenorhabditis elegans]
MARAIAIDAPLSAGIRRTKKSPIKRASVGGVKKRFSTGTAGPSRRPTAQPRRQSGGIRTVDRSIPANENREVRINLSNLAHTVHSGDLRQLFAEFKIRNVSVNFNEHGKPVGTGDVTLPKRHADRLIQKFAGVSLDGKEIKFAIIDSANIANRVKFPEAPRRAPSNGRPAQRAPKRQNVKSGKPTGGAGAQKKLKAKKPKREAQPKKTLEELDAELDVYMSKA